MTDYKCQPPRVQNVTLRWLAKVRPIKRWLCVISLSAILWGVAISGLASLSVTTSLIPPMTGNYHYNNFMPGTAGFPSVGGTYVDPVFGTTVTRLTSIGSKSSQSQIYARNGYHNSDGTKMFWWDSSTTAVINSRTGTVLHTDIPTGMSPFEISFDPVDPDVYYRFSGATLIARKLSTGVDTTVHTFPATLDSLGGSTDFIDNSGTYFVVSWGGQARIYNKSLDLVYTGAIPSDVPNNGWVGITPSGKHLVNQSTGSYPNATHYSYTIDHNAHVLKTTPVQFVGLGGDHGDLISASNGKDYEVKFNSDNSPPGVYLWDLDVSMAGKSGPSQVASAARALVTTSSYDDADGHLSCVSKGSNKDWCFWSSEYPGDAFNSNPQSAWSNYRQEIIAMNVMTGEIRRLVHHRSRSVVKNYSYQPRICVSWDGTVAAFASNFNNSSPSGYSDIYALINPLAGGAQSSPSLTPPPAPGNLSIR